MLIRRQFGTPDTCPAASETESDKRFGYVLRPQPRWRLECRWCPFRAEADSQLEVLSFYHAHECEQT